MSRKHSKKRALARSQHSQPSTQAPAEVEPGHQPADGRAAEARPEAKPPAELVTTTADAAPVAPVTPAVPAGVAPVVAEAAPVAARPPPAEVAVSDDVAESFFSAPPVTHALPLTDDGAPPDPTAEVRRRARSESGLARRRDLGRYVTGAVAVCFMICAAAAVRAATGGGNARDEATSSRPSYQPAAAPPPTTALAVADPPAVAPSAAAVVDPPSAEPAVSAEPAAPVPAKAEADPKAEAADPAPSADPAEARADKKSAQHALDRGDAVTAIDAARRSVEGDPSDAETWLILGAAYMQRGSYRDARESFASCVHDATHGPKSECRALLR
jgi:hypothetical protein